jgi:spermidine/putrescine transport system ATP-binding protein
VVVVSQGQKLQVDTARAEGVEGRAWLGVRPEKISIAPTGGLEPSGGNLLTGGTVTDVSFVGVSTQYLVAMPWGQELMVFEQNTGQRVQLRNGDKVDLGWSHDHAFLLDAQQDAHAGVITPEDVE